MRIAALTAVALAIAAPPAHADLIKISDVTDSITRAVDALQPGSARLGVTTRLAEIEGVKDPKASYRRLRRELGVEGFKVVVDDEGLTVENADGVRVLIVLGERSGAIYVTARPNARALRGRCVRPPQRRHQVDVDAGAIDQMGEYHRRQVSWDLATSPRLDVDGDGVLDWFVPIAKKHDCPESVSWDVYVRRGSCGHRLGRVGPGSPSYDDAIEPPDASGFRPIELVSESTDFGKRGIPEMTTTRSTFAVRKGRYRRVKRDKTTGVCHHCATWSCRSP